MKKKIKIVGVGVRRQGTSQNGRIYDFTPISFVFEKPSYAGLFCSNTNVNQNCMGDYIPTVGDEKEAVFHEDYKTGKVMVYAIF